MSAARRLASARPEARLWHDPVLQLKAVQLQARRDAGATGGVVFAGSSQVLEGVAPSLAAPGAGLRAYNAAVHRGFLPLTERWLLDVVLPLVEPALVVLGLGILDLNDNGVAQYEVVERFEAAPARRRGPVATARRTLHERSELARRLLARRGPSVVLRDVRVGPDGEGLEFATATEYRLSEKKRAYVEDELLGDYEFGPRTVAALDRVVTGVRATGSELALVEMPVTEELVPMLPRGEADLRAVRQVLRREADRHRVRLVTEVAEVTDRRWFADCVHHHGAGMAHVSQLLAGALAGEYGKQGVAA